MFYEHLFVYYCYILEECLIIKKVNKNNSDFFFSPSDTKKIIV